MYHSSKWVRTTLQLAAMVAVVAGAYELLSAKLPASGTVRPDASAMTSPPDRETTGSILKLLPGSKMQPAGD